MNVKSVLVQCGLTEDHFELVGAAIPDGYAALRKLADSSPMLATFMPARHGLGHLRNIAVQYALQTRAGTSDLFFTKTAFNATKSFTFLQLYANQVVLTSHYCGKHGSRGVRKAIARAELNQRNNDLFGNWNESPDAAPALGTAYAQIMHGGLSDPVLAAIRIPNRDQVTYSLEPLVLELRKPELAKVEEVQDRIAEAIKSKKKAGEQEAERLKDAG